MARIRILLSDDHALFRAGIRAVLEGFEGFEVVGEATNGKEAVEMAAALHPDVVLMDVAMPVMTGIEALRRIQKEHASTRVLMVTQYQESDYILAALRAGAKGYMPKTASAADLAAAIAAVHKGDSFLYPSATTALVEEYLLQVGHEKTDHERLSDREREILQLVAEGRSNREIAEMLFISVKTVLRHRGEVMSKLGLHNRTELIKYAISKGLIELPHQLRS